MNDPRRIPSEGYSRRALGVCASQEGRKHNVIHTV